MLPLASRGIASWTMPLCAVRCNIGGSRRSLLFSRRLVRPALAATSPISRQCVHTFPGHVAAAAQIGATLRAWTKPPLISRMLCMQWQQVVCSADASSGSRMICTLMGPAITGSQSSATWSDSSEPFQLRCAVSSSRRPRLCCLRRVVAACSSALLLSPR